MKYLCFVMKKTIITLNKLTTGYRTKKRTYTVTRDLSAVLYSGELTCLLGRNGAGKSTLLRTLAGFQAVLEGSILLENDPIEKYNETEKARRIGVVLTERSVGEQLSVYEMVSMGRIPYTGFWGTLQKKDHLLIEQAIEKVAITHLARRRMHTLSDGERQKVMIAKALAQETPIIFLDEPTAFLDFPSKVEIMHLLLKLAHEEGKTIFVSIHDLELALQTADKLWILAPNGHTAIGEPKELAQKGELDFFFKGKGIRFDSETLHYSLHAEKNVTPYV